MSALPEKSQFLIYRAEDGTIKIDVRFEDETVWLTQPLIAGLFQTTVPNISMHLRNIYQEGELSPEATIKEFLTVRQGGTREVSRKLEYYNLDGFPRVNDRNTLSHAGNTSHEMAVLHAETQYDAFHHQHLKQDATRVDDFERTIRHLARPKPPRRRKKKGQS